MKKKILILSPHTDDGELGCGGTIAKYVDEGYDVYYIAFSACEESLPPEYEKDTLVKEAKKATSVLGIKEQNIFILKYPVRKFTEFRQDILEDLIVFKKKLEPDLVILPNSTDVHQDHIVIHQEGVRAFKDSSILGYELPWNNLMSKNNCFKSLDKSYIEQKVKALHCYASQKGRVYMDQNYIFSLAKTRGTQIKKDYAESFEVIRWIF
ncbi:PIG-L family deacetylase [Candidatus Pseudothioglobus singularis]|nr:PIG-L family deacetylase [Candidatus Pseudothioglobus singularis]